MINVWAYKILFIYLYFTYNGFAQNKLHFRQYVRSRVSFYFCIYTNDDVYFNMDVNVKYVPEALILLTLNSLFHFILFTVLFYLKFQIFKCSLFRLFIWFSISNFIFTDISMFMLINYILHHIFSYYSAPCLTLWKIAIWM